MCLLFHLLTQFSQIDVPEKYKHKGQSLVKVKVWVLHPVQQSGSLGQVLRFVTCGHCSVDSTNFKKWGRSPTTAQNVERG